MKADQELWKAWKKALDEIIRLKAEIERLKKR